MKNVLKYVSFLFLLLASSRMAVAGTLSGAINFAGAGQSNSTGITFQPPPAGGQSITAPSATGDFTSYAQGQNANFTNNFTFAGISQAGGETMFKVINSAGNMQLVFQVTSYTTLANGKLVFYGTLTEYSYDSVNGRGAVIGSNSATLIYSNSGDTSFSAQLTTAPEPNSLILLGTGLVGAAGMLSRRRRALRT